MTPLKENIIFSKHWLFRIYWLLGHIFHYKPVRHTLSTALVPGACGRQWNIAADERKLH